MVKGAKKGQRLSPLTGKEAAFVREYLIDTNAMQAALRAGYSVAYANDKSYELLKKPHIAAAIKVEMDKRSKRTRIDADYVLNTIRDTIERSKQAEPVLDRKGDLVTVQLGDGTVAAVYTYDSAAVLKGCELLGKHLKLFSDRIEHSGPNGGDIPVRVKVEFVKPKESA